MIPMSSPSCMATIFVDSIFQQGVFCGIFSQSPQQFLVGAWNMLVQSSFGWWDTSMFHNVSPVEKVQSEFVSSHRFGWFTNIKSQYDAEKIPPSWMVKNSQKQGSWDVLFTGKPQCFINFSRENQSNDQSPLWDPFGGSRPPCFWEGTWWQSHRRSAPSLWVPGKTRSNGSHI